MPQFFIDRPVFAWVVALFILLAGALAIPQLPVAQYPDVAPPQIEINATYPGASAQTIDESVVSLIEEELNGADHLLYFESQSSLGSATIKATFQPGTHPEMAQVDVQNRLKVVESRLPQAVNQQGISVPQRAIQRDSAGIAHVLVIDAEQRVGQQPVELGAVQNDRWIVTGGLKPGDRIVTEGLQHARPGEKVQIDDTPLPLAQASGQ
jgi:multidrug efflux pump subunit AcrB